MFQAGIFQSFNFPALDVLSPLVYMNSHHMPVPLHSAPWDISSHQGILSLILSSTRPHTVSQSDALFNCLNSLSTLSVSQCVCVCVCVVWVGARAKWIISSDTSCFALTVELWRFTAFEPSSQLAEVKLGENGEGNHNCQVLVLQRPRVFAAEQLKDMCFSNYWTEEEEGRRSLYMYRAGLGLAVCENTNVKASCSFPELFLSAQRVKEKNRTNTNIKKEELYTQKTPLKIYSVRQGELRDFNDICCCRCW